VAQAGDVARAVVAHDPFDGDAKTLEVAQRPHQEAGHGLALLVGQDLDIGEPGRIVDGDVYELPADGAVLAAPIAGDAMADVAEAGELLDVEVDELAGACAIVPPHRPAAYARIAAISGAMPKMFMTRVRL
jgi:hypothetical protein